MVASLMLSMGSCRHEAPYHGRSPRCMQQDSILSQVKDIDSLAAIANSFHEQGNSDCEMVALRHLGSMMHNQSLFNKAIEVQTRTLTIAENLADTLEMAMALNNIATNYRRLGDLRMASTYLFKALRLCDSYSQRESHEALECRMFVLNGIGKIELQLRNNSVADSVLHESLDCARMINSSIGMAINYVSLAEVKNNRGDIDSSWIYLRNSLKYNELSNNKIGIALCHLHFGQLHEIDRRFSHAQEEYEIAYDELKHLGDSWFWLESCLALARVNLKLGEENDARTYLSEAEQEALRINSKGHQAEVYKLRCDLAMDDHNPEEAFKYFVMSDQLYDSIRGTEIDEEMRTQRINYERDRNSGELDVLNNDIMRLKRMRNIMGILGVLLLIMAAAIITALVYAVRLRAKSQRVLRQIEETRSLFFTNVVHQLRTPLTAIMGAIDDIIVDARKEGLNHYTPSQRENVVVIERQGHNLLNLMDRILEVGSVRSAIRNPEWQAGDVVPLIRMMVESYRDQCLERHIELSYASREASVEIDTVPEYLKSIVGNLLENAINYSRDFSKINVISRVDGNKFVLCVADNGMGISKEDLPHVFEAFYRGATAERLVDGVGIGLTVVRDMVMVMGGSVAVDSMKDHGSVFTVTLPTRQEDIVVEKRFGRVMKPFQRMKLTPSRRRLSRLYNPKRVASDKPVLLIIEDHNDVARLVGKVFDDRYSVHYAPDGEKGLAKANELVPNLIITDVKMPVMDGCELCRNIRASRQLCHIPVIMLSARTSKDDRIRGIEAGADIYLVKPFVREELMAWVERLLENRRLLRDNSCTATPAKPMEDTDAGTAQAAPEGISDQEFLTQFNDLIEEELNKGVFKPDLDPIALSFKMGESQLRRKIHSITGKNMTAYLTQLRMEKAMSLLQANPNLLIGDVAEQCGFADVAYFSRVFRAHYNMTPTQARNGSVNE